MSIRLRPVALTDAEMLTYWDSKPHVIAATGSDDAADWVVELATEPAWRDYFIAEDDGRPVGIVQIIDPLLEESHYWGSIEPDLRAIDIWIGEEADLGHGFGTSMMTQALDFCFASPAVSGVVIDPLEVNVRARRFYERMGFRFVGPRVFGEDECIVYRIDREDWLASGGHQ